MAQQGLEPRLQEQCTINTTGLFLIQISSSILFYVLNLVLVIIPYDKNHLRYICPLIFSFSCKLSFCESYYPVNSFGKYESQWIKFRKWNNFCKVTHSQLRSELKLNLFTSAWYLLKSKTAHSLERVKIRALKIINSMKYLPFWWYILVNRWESTPSHHMSRGV